jgi:hypothetical protein
MKAKGYGIHKNVCMEGPLLCENGHACHAKVPGMCISVLFLGTVYNMRCMPEITDPINYKPSETLDNDLLDVAANQKTVQ